MALIQRLAALAHLQQTANELISQAEQSDGTVAPLWREIDVPQSRKRAISVLGLNLTLGTVTETRKIKVRADGSRDLSAEEVEALTIYTHFCDMVAQEGIALPSICDFNFLHQLMTFDLLKFAANRKRLIALGRQSHTNPIFLREQILQAEAALPPGFADILLLTLFDELCDRSFSLDELHRFCIESSRDPVLLAKKRPFLYWEAARRPRELAIQFRDAMHRRASVSIIDTTLTMFFVVWRGFSRDIFANGLDIALGVFSGFSVVFAGDRHEKEFSEIGSRIVEVLSAEKPNYESCVLWVTTTYGKTL
jgi:hypothetical protein